MSFPLQRDEPNLLQQLRKAGYYVWWGGKNDLVTDEAGFRESCNFRNKDKVNHKNLHADQEWRQGDPSSPDYSFFAGKLDKLPTEEIYLDSDWSHVLAAERFIQSYDGEKPFCIFLALQYPHPPYGVENPYYDLIDRSKLPTRVLPSTLKGKPLMHELLRSALQLGNKPEVWWDELRATYYGMCSRVDEQAGLILRSLREKGCYDDTAFFLFSDHGDYTGDYGLVEKVQNLFEDCLTRVPFILKPPADLGRFSGLRHGLVELVDFPSTVYDLAGIRPDYTHFGQSLLNLLEKDGRHRDAVFSCGGRLQGEAHCAVESNGGHEDKNYLYHPRLKIQAADYVAHGKAIMCREQRFKLVSRLYERDELYDLELDPTETCNRIEDPQLQSHLDRLRRRTQQFLMETSDIVPWTHCPREVPSWETRQETTDAEMVTEASQDTLLENNSVPSGMDSIPHQRGKRAFFDRKTVLHSEAPK